MDVLSRELPVFHDGSRVAVAGGSNYTRVDDNGKEVGGDSNSGAMGSVVPVGGR